LQFFEPSASQGASRYTTSEVIYSYFSENIALLTQSTPHITGFWQKESLQRTVKGLLLLAFVIFFMENMQAQNVEKYREDDYVRKTEWSVGIKLHTHGYGLAYNWGKFINIRKKVLWQIEVQEIKHPKEFRRQSIYKDFPIQPPTARGYTFGKINNLYNLNVSRVWQRVLTRKGRKSGVEVSVLYKAGVSLGVVKPYVLNLVLSLDGFNAPDIVEQTFEDNPELFLTTQNIYGGTNFVTGFDKASIIPGGIFKLGFLFDWANYNESVKAIEVGAMVNVYYKKVPIMAEAENHFLYGNLYLKVLFGKRK